MKPLTNIDTSVLKGVNLLLSDIDDTITEDGHLPSESYSALNQLQERGFSVVLITGRPAGWCDMIARFFPVDAVVGENGALCFYRDGEHIHQIWHDEAAQRKVNLERLHLIANDIVAEFSGTALAQDNPWRASDVAVDFAEDVPPLSVEVANAIKTRFEEHGATAKVSSIHVNAWFGLYDKLSMFKRWLYEVQGKKVKDILNTTIYVGDSPNDVPMFRQFPYSVGVQGIMKYTLNTAEYPQYVTEADSACGFVEISQRLLSAKDD